MDSTEGIADAQEAHPVRKVGHLLCETPLPTAFASAKLARATPTRRRGPRGRFVGREGAASLPAPVDAGVVKRPYRRTYANATPSGHCHVCARTAKAVRFAVCARVTHGLCRKVVCDKCFSKFGWDWDAAVRDRNWLCVHCRNACPEGRSQCHIYSRVNRKRGTKRGAKKSSPTSLQAMHVAKGVQLQRALPRFGDPGYLSQGREMACSGSALQRLASHAALSSYAPVHQTVHTVQSVPDGDGANWHRQSMCTPVMQLPPVAYTFEDYDAVHDVHYGSLSLGIDVTETSHEAGALYLETPFPLRR